MCVSINDARGLKNYIEEYLSYGAGSWGVTYAKSLLASGQKSHGWLTDYEIVDAKLVKKITGEPGVQAIERAIEEVVKTGKGAPTKRTVKDKRKAKAEA